MFSRTCRTIASLTTLALTAACFAPTTEFGEASDGWIVEDDPEVDREISREQAVVVAADPERRFDDEHLPEPEPEEEVCDGEDNNEDGEVDEGFDVGLQCPVPGALGVCAWGEVMCTPNGKSTCLATSSPSLETCDGIDNDCDGLVDGADSDAPWPAADDYEHGGTYLGDPASKVFESLGVFPLPGETTFSDPDDKDFYLVHVGPVGGAPDQEPPERHNTFCRVVSNDPNLQLEMSLGSRRLGEPELPHLSETSTCYLAAGEVCELVSAGDVEHVAIALKPRYVDPCVAGYELECVEGKVPAHW